jgi:hypothetical protein
MVGSGNIASLLLVRQARSALGSGARIFFGGFQGSMTPQSAITLKHP